METKPEIIKKHKCGMELSVIAKEYGWNPSTLLPFRNRKKPSKNAPEVVPQPDVEEIVSLGRSMGLVVDEEDINKLLEEHKQEPTTDDLKELEAIKVNIVQE